MGPSGALSRYTGREFTMLWCLCLFLFGAVAAFPQSNPNSPAAVKFMIAGDSMTQGFEGDYTWRYRLWQWLRADTGRPTVSFVGPFGGSREQSSPQSPQPPAAYGVFTGLPAIKINGTYARDTVAEWQADSSHYSNWGWAMAHVQANIAAQVATYQPDYLLVALGFNDLAWFVEPDARSLLVRTKQLVDNARAAKSNVRLILATVPQRTFLGGREDLVTNTDQYNRLLKAAVSSWSTAQSPIQVADFQAEYTCNRNTCPVGYDGAHPNARGEYEIARAFSKAVVAFGLRTGEPLAVPTSVPTLPVPATPRVQAAGDVMGVKITWGNVYGANRYEVRTRIQGAADWSVTTSESTRSDITFTVAGINWETQVRARIQSTWGEWSSIVSAISRRDTATPPRDIYVDPTVSNGVKVIIPPGAGAEYWEVWLWDRDQPGSQIEARGSPNTTPSYNNLVAGHRYDIYVVAWTRINGVLAGTLPGSAGSFIAGRTPSPPTNLAITTIDPLTVNLNWAAGANNVGWKVFLRNFNQAGSLLNQDQGLLTTTSHSVGLLFPGAWNFEICVSAVNGNVESTALTCARAPRI